MVDDKRLTIAVMMRDINTEFSEAMYDGFYMSAKEANVNLVFLLGPQFPLDVEEVVRDSVDVDFNYQLDSVFDYVHILKPDALLIVSGSVGKSIVLPDVNALVERYKEIPCIVLEDIPAHPSVAYQVADSYTAMCECVEHLIVNHGYTNIVYVTASLEEYDFKTRYKAFMDTCQAHHLEVLDEQVVICDEESLIERRINAIFDDIYNVDAVVCCCDEYAKIAYEACAIRGIAVGKDVAITGFDDLGNSKMMNPPLTSVTHNSFLFGYNALRRAVKLANGGNVGGYKTPCHFKKRASCGCKQFKNPNDYSTIPDDPNSKKKLASYLKKKIEKIADDIYTLLPYENEKKRFVNIFDEMFNYIYQMIFTDWSKDRDVYDKINEYIKYICKFDKISIRMLADKCEKILEGMVRRLPNEEERAKATAIRVEMNKRFVEAEMKRLKTENIRKNAQLWFVPFFTRDIMKSNISYSDTLNYIMKRLKGMSIKSAHIFLFKRPVVCKKNQLPPPPEELYQAAYFNESEMRVYLQQNAITINWDNGIKSMLATMDGHNYSAFVLYSSDRQYGIVFYEIDRDDVFFAMTCSLQIGSLLHFRDISDAEEEAMDKVRQQNDILSYLSAKDELTSSLNRRGFMEKVLSLIYRHNGKNAYVLFADVAHLKEINDEYGHLAGDNAIRACSEYLKNALGRDALIGRIGGDEFVTVIISDDTDIVEKVRKDINKQAEDYNKVSDEKFNIEVILGSYQFVCKKGMSVTEILEKSHEVMTEEKKKHGRLIKK